MNDKYCFSKTIFCYFIKTNIKYHFEKFYKNQFFSYNPIFEC